MARGRSVRGAWQQELRAAGAMDHGGGDPRVNSKDRSRSIDPRGNSSGLAQLAARRKRARVVADRLWLEPHFLRDFPRLQSCVDA